MKISVSRSNQINGKLRGDNRNYLGCRKYWWFGSQNNKETGQTEGKIWINIYMSRILPKTGISTKQQHRVWKLTWWLKVLVVWGSKQQARGKTGSKIWMKINVSKVQPN